LDALGGVTPLVELDLYMNVRGLLKVKTLVLGEIYEGDLVRRGSLVEGGCRAIGFLDCLRDTFMGQREHLEKLND
jgi:hypothetical protein